MAAEGFRDKDGHVPTDATPLSPQGQVPAGRARCPPPERTRPPGGPVWTTCLGRWTAAVHSRGVRGWLPPRIPARLLRGLWEGSENTRTGEGPSRGGALRLPCPHPATQGPASHTLGLGRAPCFSSAAAKPDRPGRARPGSHTRTAAQPVGSQRGSGPGGRPQPCTPEPLGLAEQVVLCPWPAWAWRDPARGSGPSTPLHAASRLHPPGSTPKLQIRGDSAPTGEGPCSFLLQLGWVSPHGQEGLRATTQHGQGSQAFCQRQHRCHPLQEAPGLLQLSTSRKTLPQTPESWECCTGGGADIWASLPREAAREGTRERAGGPGGVQVRAREWESGLGAKSMPLCGPAPLHLGPTKGPSCPDALSPWQRDPPVTVPDPTAVP